jgi:hypothetical protein
MMADRELVVAAKLYRFSAVRLNQNQAVETQLPDFR